MSVYPWQLATWQRIEKQMQEGRLHHAILYLAQKGSGELALTSMLAKTLLCLKSQTKPCDVCHSCQLFDAGTHPDFHKLSPESEGKQLGIETIRFGNKVALQTSQLGALRVILIENADSLTEAGANALLKTLEEPPAACFFLLQAQSSSAILPTILSRCSQYSAGTLPEPLVKTWLESQLQRPVSLQTLRLHQNSPLAARDFILQGKEQSYTELLHAFSQFLQAQNALFSLSASLIKEEKMLAWLGLAMLDALKLQQSAELEILHLEARALIEQIACLPSCLLLSQLRKLNHIMAQLKKQPGLNSEILLSHWLTQFIQAESTVC